MKHAVIGTGFIGSYLVAHLLRAHYHVIALGRDSFRAHFNQGVAQPCLTISDYNDFRWQQALSEAVFFTQRAQCSQAVDIVWVTVKCTGLDNAITDIRAFLKPNTLIVACQNGMGSEQILRKAFPQHVIIRAMFPFNVVSPTPGEFRRSSSGAIALEYSGKTDIDLDRLITALQYKTFPIHIEHNMDGLLWAKIQLNLTNSVNALSGKSLQATLLDSEYRYLVAKMMEEHVLVCRTAGLRLPQITTVPAQWIPKILHLPTWLFKRVAKSMVAIDPAAKLSMWWDLEYARPTEADFINQATIRLGQKVGVATPLNNAVYACLKAHETERLKGLARHAFSVSEIMTYTALGK